MSKRSPKRRKLISMLTSLISQKAQTSKIGRVYTSVHSQSDYSPKHRSYFYAYDKLDGLVGFESAYARSAQTGLIAGRSALEVANEWSSSMRPGISCINISHLEAKTIRLLLNSEWIVVKPMSPLEILAGL